MSKSKDEQKMPLLPLPTPKDVSDFLDDTRKLLFPFIPAPTLTPSGSGTETSLTSETEPSKLDYCLECCDKHFGGSSKLSEEAIIFYGRSGGMTEDVQAKVSSIVKELAGLHDDIGPSSPSEVMDLLHGADRIRKDIWRKKLEIGGGTRDDLVALKRSIDVLKQQTLDVAKQTFGGGCIRWCTEWGAKDLNECISLFTKAQEERKVSPEEFERHFFSLTGKKAKAQWDEKGRLVKVNVE